MEDTGSTNSFSAIMTRFGRVPSNIGKIASGSECKEQGKILPGLH